MTAHRQDFEEGALHGRPAVRVVCDEHDWQGPWRLSAPRWDGSESADHVRQAATWATDADWDDHCAEVTV